MPHIHTDWWSLEVPDDWLIDKDEEGAVSISDPDEIGCLDLLVLQKQDGGSEDEAITSLATASLEHAETVHSDVQAVNVGQFEGVSIAFAEEQLEWREWFLQGEEFILLVSYNTDQENKGLDDSIVDQILETLVIEPIGSD